MSETFTTLLEAGPDMRYAPGAWDRTIGDTIRVNLPGGGRAEGIIRAAVVSEDGSEAAITVELPDGTLPGQPLSGAQPLVGAVWRFRRLQFLPDLPPRPETPVPERQDVTPSRQCRPVFEVHDQPVTLASVKSISEGGEEPGRVGSRGERRGAQGGGVAHG